MFLNTFDEPLISARDIMQTRYIYLLRYVLLISDVIMLNIVYFASFHITLLLGKSLAEEIFQQYVLVCNLIWLFNTAIFGLYTFKGEKKLESIYRGTWRSVVLHIMLFAFFLMLAKDVNFSRMFLAVFYSLLSFSFIINRFLGTAVQYRFSERFNVARKVAVMGSNVTALRISAYLEKQKNINFYGFVGDDDSMYSLNGIGISERTSIRLAEAAYQGVMEVYVAVDLDRMTEVAPLIQEAERQCIRLKFIPDFGGAQSPTYTVSELGGKFPVITLREEPLEDMHNRFKKRIFDVLFSSLVIVFILSWMYPLIALFIKLQSKGPVLFKQQRSGRNDETFWCFKFRSMRMNGLSDEVQASRNDDRITPIGRFLRRTSLDEMPQFFNVFLGNMSVVGPRPHMLKHTEEYKAIVSQYMVRQFLKPGITGWAQVNGLRGETKTHQDMENRVKMDLHYLEHWSAMFDVKIVFMTVINLLRGEDNAF
ncbi:MAG TPA: undecaprenyl-phosphate glucose phosphotransferase [Pedobacter sp.]|nr:undecaprenyl-phosphate glucose phosphotransferase [Pedobacter sp.]